MLKAPRSAAHARKEELREDQLATATARTRSFFEENQRPLVIAAVVIAVLAVAVFAWRWWRAAQDQKAAEALGAVLTAYEEGRYEEALEGTPEQPGLLAIADRYGSTDTGNLATFFAADALYQLGRYDEAGGYFTRYNAGEDLLGASALAAQAGLAEMRGAWMEAGPLYLRAAGAYPAVATAPDYLMAAARSFEAGGDLDRARQALRQLREEATFAETPAAQAAEIDLARLDAMAAAGIRPEARPAPPPPVAPPAAAASPFGPGGLPGAGGPIQLMPPPADAPADAETPAEAPADGQ